MSIPIRALVRLTLCSLVAFVALGQVGAFKDAAAEPITLDESIARALARNPNLAAQSLAADAAEARARQAGLRPNPEVSSELEDFGGPGDLSELESAQLTIQLTQTIELGGKAGKRKKAKALTAELASLDFDWQRRLLQREVTVRFASLLAAQERVGLKREIVDVQGEVMDAVAKRVAAGKDRPLDETRAQVELSEAELDLRSAERHLQLARERLALTWGGQGTDFSDAVSLHSQISPPEERQELTTRLSQNPLIAGAAVQESHMHAELSLAKALRIPDVTIGGGVRHYYVTEEQAYVASLTIPLPLFDRNQGGIEEAKLGVSMAAARRQASEAALRLELEAAHTRLIDAYAALSALREEIVSAAERSFETALAGYRNGKYEYLLVLDAQRRLFEVREREVQAREDYFQAWADVRLLADPSPESLGGTE